MTHNFLIFNKGIKPQPCGTTQMENFFYQVESMQKFSHSTVALDRWWTSYHE